MILEPTEENLHRAVRAIRDGKLVGLPTETVYGIGCDAMNEAAVRSVFALKGRPAENPLIVHLFAIDWVDRICAAFPPIAERLANRYWPGPLTIVLPKRPDVPDAVTAGLPTVAVRVPNHVECRMLIQFSDRPLAAPSANRFMALSPSRPEDISAEIGSGLELILNGGPCKVGIESTVIDLSKEPFQLLRPGIVSREELEWFTGPLLVPESVEGSRPAPGMYRRHYAPRARLVIVDRISEGVAGLVLHTPPGPNQVGMPPNAADYARRLYHELHDLDIRGVDVIEVEAPPEEWEAVWDRLRKASTS